MKLEGLESLKYLKALGSKVRLNIYDLLHQKDMSIMEISKVLHISRSFVTKEVKQLETAGLIETVHKPGIRGSQKLCKLVYNEITYRPSPKKDSSTHPVNRISIPIGAYRKFEVHPTCGLVSEKAIIGMRDDPRSFFDPNHISAQMLWFSRGWVEYAFPRNHPKDAIIEEITISMEISSEGAQPIGENECPSDISIWLNGTKIGPWNSWGFYTMKKGNYTPSWWSSKYNQFGLLKTWKINAKGSFVDGEKISSVKADDIDLNGKTSITLKVGIDENEKNIGGICLFGEKFGNHPQDILVGIKYRRKSEQPSS
ncbi:MAG: MarR family transcriptional regulator [Candidatus Ratteibacteria bacterium]